MNFKLWLEWEDTDWTDGGDTVTIKQIIDYLQDKPIVNLDPQQLISQLPPLPDLETERISGADLNYPIIIVSRGNEPLYVLDGNHRLKKAVDTQQPIKSQMLDIDDPNLPPQWRELFSEAKTANIFSGVII